VFIYANEGKPREITQVVDVTQIIMKDYTYNKIMYDYIMYGTSSIYSQSNQERLFKTHGPVKSHYSCVSHSLGPR